MSTTKTNENKIKAAGYEKLMTEYMDYVKEVASNQNLQFYFDRTAKFISSIQKIWETTQTMILANGMDKVAKKIVKDIKKEN